MGHRTRRGAKFSDTSVTRLIQDTTAKGVRIANYTQNKGGRWTYKPEEEWVFMSCPANISEELWETCNQLMEQQRNSTKRVTQPTVHLFAGYLYCGCGGKMYVYSRGTNYKCSKCRKTKIEIADFEEIYFGELKSFLLSEENLTNFFQNQMKHSQIKKSDFKTSSKRRRKSKWRWK